MSASTPALQKLHPKDVPSCDSPHIFCLLSSVSLWSCVCVYCVLMVSLCCSNKGHYSDRKYVNLWTGTLVCSIFAFQFYATGFNLLIIYVHLLLRKYVQYVIPLLISFFLRQNYGTCSFYFFDPGNTNFKLRADEVDEIIIKVLNTDSYVILQRGPRWRAAPPPLLCFGNGILSKDNFFSSRLYFNRRISPSTHVAIEDIRGVPVALWALQGPSWTRHYHHVPSMGDIPSQTCFDVDVAANEIAQDCREGCVWYACRLVFKAVVVCGFLPFRFFDHPTRNTWSL